MLEYHNNQIFNFCEKLLSAAERRGTTPVLLSALVSDNLGNPPQMAAPRRSCEIDQSTQRFHVGCDNRCLLGNEYGGLHGRDFNCSNFNKSSSFCNIVCGKDTSIGAAIFILMLNHADVIGDQSDAVTQNAWFLCALCAANSGEISILIQTGAESWGRFSHQESAVGRAVKYSSSMIWHIQAWR